MAEKNNELCQMTKKTDAPAIRFKGFSGAWEQRKLSDVVDSVDTGKSKFDKEGSSGEYPILGSTSVIGYDDEYDYDGDFILTARVGANAGSLYRYAGKVKISDNTVFIQTSQNIEFLYQLLARFDIKKLSFGTGQPLVKASELKSLELMMPTDLAEQQKIGAYFRSLDHLITLHQRKLTKLQNIKKACLEKMFPCPSARLSGGQGRRAKNGSNVPEIRFKGFTDPACRQAGAWEQRKLGDIGKARSGVGFPDAEQGGVIGVPFFKVSDMNLDGNENEMTIANNYVTAEQIANYRWSPITELPAIFFAKVGAAVMLNRKRLCRFPFLLDNNTMAYSLSPTKWDADFAKALFGTVDLTSLVQVGALPSYNAGDVESMEIYLPSLLEQEQIGAYFKQLDHLITLHQRKLTKLQNIKKACLEKMFPQA